ncbi:MAG TPA: TlpA disulfide reductase family protein [Streptosporangiaceae bacterium]|nr:TlpA disulfide reductase family protein [Streptosporangiaceae bacterium]
MEQQSWAGAVREVWHTAVRHKIASGLVALCVVASLVTIALVASGPAGPAGAAADPASPSFSLPVLGQSGQKVSLADYAGRPLIVNFFASWCEPCKQETPLLAKFYRTEHGRVAIVGLDENDVLGSAMTFTRNDGVSYPVGFDHAVIAASAYGVAALPQTFFLNAKHRIVDRVFGAVTLADINRGIALATAG